MVTGDTPSAPVIFVGRADELRRICTSVLDLRLAAIYGVAGVGKTSLLLKAAEQLCSRVEGRLLYHSCKPGDDVATIAAAICGEPRSVDPVTAIAEVARDGPTVLCLDGLHVLDGEALPALIAGLSGRRRPLWSLLSSRSALPISPAQVDHMVVRLEPFTPAEARELWTTLEELYGPAPVPFEEVLRRGAATPLMVKLAFADPSTLQDDVLGLRALTAFELELLGEMCTHRGPVPPTALGRRHDRSEVEAALGRLLRRFLVERRDGHLAAYDLVRDAAVRVGAAGTPAVHARCMEYHQSLSALGPSDELDIEILHHAVRCERDDLAADILARYASHARRPLPLSSRLERELLGAIDAISARRQPPSRVLLLRARVTARTRAVTEAYHALATAGLESDPLVDLELGEILHALGRGREAIAHLRLAFADERLPSDARIWAAVVLFDTLRLRGAVLDAARHLDEAAPLLRDAGSLGEAILAFLRGMLAHEREDVRAAREAIVETRRAIAASPPLAIATPLLGSLANVIDAFGGEVARRVAEPRREDEFIPLTRFVGLAARVHDAEALLCRGDPRGAAALLESVLVEADAAGYEGHDLAIVCMLSECQRIIGQPGAVIDRLQAVRREASGAGLARSVARVDLALARVKLSQGDLLGAHATAVEGVKSICFAPNTAARLAATAALAEAAMGRASPRVQSLDDLSPHARVECDLWSTEALLWAGDVRRAAEQAQAVETAAMAGGWRWIACRARILAGEARLRAGDVPGAEALIDPARAVAEEAGYAAEALLAALVVAAGRRMRGDLDLARSLLSEVANRAGALGLDLEAQAAREGLAVLGGAAPPKSLNALARRLSLSEPVAFRLRAGKEILSLTRGQVATLDESGFDLFVDTPGARLRTRRRRFDLARRATLLELLRALLAHGRALSQAELMSLVWGTEFHPIRHRGRVPMAIARLRELLGKESIVATRDGYRLCVPSSWAVLEDLAATT